MTYHSWNARVAADWELVFGVPDIVMSDGTQANGAHLWKYCHSRVRFTMSLPARIRIRSRSGDGEAEKSY
jgi:hypothetical protein